MEDPPAGKPRSCPPGWGTLMRHFPLPEPLSSTVASLTPGVVNTSRPCRLIATPCPSERVATGRHRTPRPAVDLTPVTRRADPHLAAAPPAQEEPEILSQPRSALPRGWTRQRFPAILIPDAAPAASALSRPRAWLLPLRVLGLCCPRQPGRILAAYTLDLAALRRDDAVSFSTVPSWRSRDKHHSNALFDRHRQ